MLKPASAGALEKYLGSGLIKGVGPKTAQKIVRHFGKETLEVFEERIERLTEVPGIANKKLSSISTAWQEHRAIRDVMLFLQSHGISTLFAVRIYKQYGDNSITLVSGSAFSPPTRWPCPSASGRIPLCVSPPLSAMSCLPAGNRGIAI